VIGRNDCEVPVNCSLEFYGKAEQGSLDFDEIPEKSSVKFLEISQLKIVGVPANTFKSFPNLRTLIIKNNQIEWIHWKAFNSLEYLETLEISNNNLEKLGDIIRNIPNIKEFTFGELEKDFQGLNFDKNQILDKISITSRYRDINQNVTSELMRCTKSLNLENLISLKVGYDYHQITEKLSINLNSNWETLSINSSQSLKHLKIHGDEDTYNKPTIPTIKNLTNLEFLEIFGIKVTENNLKEITKMINLEKLNLTFCGIRLIPSDFAKNLSRLESLDVRSNYIQILDLKILPSNDIKIYVDDNDLGCNWLEKFAETNSSTFDSFIFTENFDEFNVKGLKCLPILAIESFSFLPEKIWTKYIRPPINRNKTTNALRYSKSMILFGRFIFSFCTIVLMGCLYYSCLKFIDCLREENPSLQDYKDSDDENIQLSIVNSRYSSSLIK
jgi:Leucine-rich repeat (LRR) protein